VSALSETTLSTDERRLLDRFASELHSRLGERLHAIWLFGSRARGEAPSHEDSDVDLLVLTDDASWEATTGIYLMLYEIATELKLERAAAWFVIHVHTTDWLADRRAIKSFFIQSVDRDKVVVGGSA
jgi:predicted nucleotidyltransferase